MASPNISFSEIPASIRKPGKYVEFNTALAVRTLPANLQKVLIIGQRLASGSVLADVPTDVFSDDQAATYFGRGSIIHRMVIAAIKANAYLQLTCIAVDDAGGSVAASGTVTISGPATGSGTLTLNVGPDSVTIAISSGDAANSIAAALNAELAKYPNLPVSATVLNAVVTLTAKNKGTLGNQIKVSAAVTAAGVGAAIVAMASGATDPTLTTTLAAVFASGHHVLISAWNDQTSLTALRTHLDAVSNGLEMRGAVGVYGHTGTLANATTLAGQVNSGRITGALLPSSQSLPYEVAAAYGAVIAFEEDPARPLNFLELLGIATNPQANWLSRTEQENALNNGVAPLEIGPGSRVQIVRAITTYTLDPQSIPDIALLDLMTIRSMDYVRKAVRERIALRFPRDKKTRRVKSKVRSEILDVLYKLEELEIVENVAENAAGVLVEDDLQDPTRLNAKIPCDVVNGLHVFAARIDLLL
jgi:phage tail sheath gpL-like